MRLLGLLLSIFAVVSKGENMCDITQHQNKNCIQFIVGSGTGCDWMCNYCANQLGTNNYYFTDNVCTYQEGQGCIGSPVAGNQYTCCSV